MFGGIQPTFEIYGEIAKGHLHLHAAPPCGFRFGDFGSSGRN